LINETTDADDMKEHELVSAYMMEVYGGRTAYLQSIILVISVWFCTLYLGDLKLGLKITTQILFIILCAAHCVLALISKSDKRDPIGEFINLFAIMAVGIAAMGYVQLFFDVFAPTLIIAAAFALLGRWAISLQDNFPKWFKDNGGP